ncbi:MAG: type III pantothenate kinase [Bdellovibrio bacteriovorus]
MNLLLDIGNTSLRWVVQEGPDLGDSGSVLHGGGVPLDLIVAWESLAAPRRVLLSNVGGAAVGAAVVRVVRALWGVEPEPVAVRASCLGLRIAYEDPSRLGVDRWLALLAARAHWDGPALIVDAGTAVTYDLLLDGGRHLGGLILPGIELMRRALLQGTGLGSMGLNPVPPINGSEPWATDTGTAVAAGGIQALGALSDRLYDRLVEGCGQPSASRAAGATPRLLLTGGDAEHLAPAIGRPFEVVPDLVLRGLGRLAEALV